MDLNHKKQIIIVSVVVVIASILGITSLVIYILTNKSIFTPTNTDNTAIIPQGSDTTYLGSQTLTPVPTITPTESIPQVKNDINDAETQIDNIINDKTLDTNDLNNLNL